MKVFDPNLKIEESNHPEQFYLYNEEKVIINPPPLLDVLSIKTLMCGKYIF